MIGQSLPSPLTLYVSGKSEQFASGELTNQPGFAFNEPFPGVVSVSCASHDLVCLLDHWMEYLEPDQLESVSCCVVPQGILPTTAELMDSHKLKDLFRWCEGQWLNAILDDRRLVTYFQSIVKIDCPDDVFAYECLIRGCDESGDIIPPNRMFGAARATGQVNRLDTSARMQAIETSRREQVDSHVFINFNPQFVDESFICLRHAIEAMEKTHLPLDRFVFEVVESDRVTDEGKLARIVEFCRQHNCRVALDDLGAGYNSLNLLADLRPDYIKLDMQLVRGVEYDPYRSRVAGKLIELARDLGIKTVVEGIETIGAWQWSQEHGADYGQGYLFSIPAAVPPVPEKPFASRPVVVGPDAKF